MTQRTSQTADPGNPPIDIETSEETSLAISKSPNKAFLRKSQADLEDCVALYPEPCRTETVWVQGFCRESCNGNIELLRSVAEKIGFTRSYAFFYNALHGYSYKPGKGKGDIGYWVELCKALREHDRIATAAGKRGFLETPTYRCIRDFIDGRREIDAACKFGGITGPTGSQKSACLKYYRVLNNHGKVVYMEAPARKGLIAFQRKLGDQYGSKIKNNSDAREKALRANINETKCIIIDNAQRLYFHGKGNDQPIFDYLLEIQDDTNCTIILCWTEDFVQGDLIAGRARNYFEQFVGRMGGIEDLLKLPNYTPESDLSCIAKAYNLRDGVGAMDMLKRWSKMTGRVRIVFHRLKRTRDIAQVTGGSRITLQNLEQANEYVPPAIGEEEDEGGAV